MQVRRTYDLEIIDAIARDPSVYPYISRDDSPAPPNFTLAPFLTDPHNVFLLATEGTANAGFWLFHHTNPGIYDVHTHILADHRGRPAYDGSQLALDFMFLGTDCNVVTTTIPDFNKAAASFARYCGMVPTYTRPASFLKHGIKQDQHCYYLPMPQWFFRNTPTANNYTHGYLTAIGERFHTALESSLGKPNHPHDATHDCCAGVGLALIRNGLPDKAQWFYNYVAPILGYMPARFLGAYGATFTLHVGNAIVRAHYDNDNVEVIEVL